MGWRRAFCTTPLKDSDRDGDDGGAIFKSFDPPPPLTPSLSASRSPRFGGRLNFFTSSSNPSTPRLRCRTKSGSSAMRYISETQSSMTTTKIDEKPVKMKSPKSSLFGTSPSSPKSPLKIALFRNSFRSRNGCGVCNQSVKSGRGTAVYTAQCGHVYHFPCIATHVRGTAGRKLACLVCNVEWSDEPLLTVHQNLQPHDPQWNCSNVEIQEKHVISSTPKPPLPARPQFHHYQTRPVQITCYSDDEPLSSPCARKPLFNPILELEEEGEETSMITKHRNQNSPTSVGMRLMPESALVSSTSDHQTCAVVLKVKAPQLPQTARISRRTPLLDASRRAPIDLVAVLDVSGSMIGAKMQMMRRAMRLVISSLGPQDRLSIVAFSAVPKRLLPFRRMTEPGQRAARSIVDRMECSRGSCVGDALRKAAKVLEDRRERNPVATIILLSDCQDDSPESKRPEQAATRAAHNSTTRFAHVEIPVNSPGDEMFAKWVGGLLSVVVQDLKIELGFAQGSAPSEITAVYCGDRQTSLLRLSSVQLGDLYAEEERELLIELRVPVAAIRAEKLLSIKCSYKDPATHERISTEQETFILPQACLSPGIQRLRNVFITTRAVAESRLILEHGEFSSAHRLLSSARDLLMQSAFMSADECVQALEAEIMELARRRQEQQVEEQQRAEAAMRLQQPMAETTPPPPGKKKSWNRVSDLHSFENARF